jgi:hypothetical protein
MRAVGCLLGLALMVYLAYAVGVMAVGVTRTLLFHR